MRAMNANGMKNEKEECLLSYYCDVTGKNNFLIALKIQLVTVNEGLSKEASKQK